MAVTTVMTLAWDRKSMNEEATPLAADVAVPLVLDQVDTRAVTNKDLAAERPIPGEEVSIPPAPVPETLPGVDVAPPATVCPGASVTVSCTIGTPACAKDITASARSPAADTLVLVVLAQEAWSADARLALPDERGITSFL